MMYHDYLRKYKRVTYSGLMLSGKLKEQIEEVDRQAEEMFSRLVEQMKQAEDVTEQLKASNQMEWVRRMNSTAEVQAFSYGFRLGARLMNESGK